MTPKLAFELLAPEELSEEDFEHWELIRGSSSIYRSPYFGHRFTTAVASCQDDCYVAIARSEGKLTAALPIQVGQGRHARPVGLGINDAHGIIKPESLELSAVDLCRNVGLSSYTFHASPPELPDSEKFATEEHPAFIADFSICPDGYEADLRSRSTTVDRQDQKTRRLAREAGELLFEFDCRSTDMLERLIDWKRQQYQRTHTFDIFSQAWIRKLLRTLHKLDRDGMHGLLSVLFAGETPVAMHFGLYESNFLHYWFPVFDPTYGYGSPGTELFLQVVRQCQQIGVHAIDFGYGEQPYKHKLTNARYQMSGGLADKSVVRRTAYRYKNQARQLAKKAPGKGQLKPLFRAVLPRFGGSAYEN